MFVSQDWSKDWRKKVREKGQKVRSKSPKAICSVGKALLVAYQFQRIKTRSEDKKSSQKCKSFLICLKSDASLLYSCQDFILVYRIWIPDRYFSLPFSSYYQCFSLEVRPHLPHSQCIKSMHSKKRKKTELLHSTNSNITQKGCWSWFWSGIIS